VLAEVMESQRMHPVEYVLQMTLLDLPRSTLHFFATPHRIGHRGSERE
jgi:hypothetical protein